jgi:hypothetical protein
VVTTFYNYLYFGGLPLGFGAAFTAGDELLAFLGLPFGFGAAFPFGIGTGLSPVGIAEDDDDDDCGILIAR